MIDGADMAMMEALRTRATDAEARRDLLLDVLREWWDFKCPPGWSDEQHEANPFIGCADGREKRLVRAMLGLPMEQQ